jgi:uncharacterized protein (TIGR03546 family)
MASVLGTMLGFVPGFSQAPELLIALTFALVVINANLVLAALVGVVAKLVAFPLVPLAYSTGTFLLDGPARGFFKTFVNSPVLAFFGLEYYTVTGGQFLGLILGLVIGVLLSFGMTSFRKKRRSGKEQRKVPNLLIQILGSCTGLDHHGWRRSKKIMGRLSGKKDWQPYTPAWHCFYRSVW